MLRLFMDHQRMSRAYTRSHPSRYWPLVARVAKRAAAAATRAALSAAVAPLGKVFPSSKPTRVDQRRAAASATKRQYRSVEVVRQHRPPDAGAVQRLLDAVDDPKRFADVLLGDFDQHAEREPAQIQRRQAFRVGDGGEPRLDANSAPRRKCSITAGASGSARLTEA